MKKSVLIILMLFIVEISSAQCAMCKAVVENGNESMGEGVNDGITYLMVFPYILVGALFYFLYKHKQKDKI
ncbi:MULTISPECIES: hypothetical protein [Tenacibaculum]|uniref:hypothetical protein n=1 Tax=Tenacibaculum TaxID=104267 RepID=UPI001F0B26C1|nr:MULTISPECIES: hypothetical protein [Tenacibaculum]MCH3881070.1 hypothetical protein [Tenacibaculum aquimarinum]MDO6599330.1 hypothetical protein [Tenacibaculum sp. 1_MG-2023]